VGEFNAALNPSLILFIPDSTSDSSEVEKQGTNLNMQKTLFPFCTCPAPCAVPCACGRVTAPSVFPVNFLPVRIPKLIVTGRRRLSRSPRYGCGTFAKRGRIHIGSVRIGGRRLQPAAPTIKPIEIRGLQDYPAHSPFLLWKPLRHTLGGLTSNLRGSELGVETCPNNLFPIEKGCATMLRARARCSNLRNT
jgi:hypothetical protein